MSLDPNITLMGDLDKYQLSGDAMNAMNTLYARIVKSGAVFLGQFDPDATLGTETGLRHWSCQTPKQTIFFCAGNSTGVWKLQVYGHGIHYGDDNNKQYKLYTWEHGGKDKLYSF